MAEIDLAYGELRNDPETFETLGKLHDDLRGFSNQSVAINCSNLSWFDAHLSGPLRMITWHAEANGNVVVLRALKPHIRDILSKNGLLKRKIADVHGTTMPVRRFFLNASKEFAQYTKQNLSRPEMPQMTPQLARKFHEGLDEIFANSSMHSDSASDIAVSGQFYPRKHLINISISDGGIGMIGSVRKSGIKIRGHADAIAWAMEKNNTTKIGDIPGGLGLAVLKEFVKANNGKLIVASKEGYWCMSGKDVSKKSLQWAFPGTAIVLEINTADKKAYDLTHNLKANEIW